MWVDVASMMFMSGVAPYIGLLTSQYGSFFDKQIYIFLKVQNSVGASDH